jgi:hypothetical protein
MKTLHIANTFFEWELSGAVHHSLYAAFHKHPVYLQLQFLPAIYAAREDCFLVSDFSDTHYDIEHFSLASRIPQDALRIESWGASQWIAKWAKNHGISYEMPEWNAVREVNSKVFSFLHSPPLSGAALLQNEKEARAWIAATTIDKVLKTAYGVSGRGHLLIKNDAISWKVIDRFLRREWNQGNLVIAEPWVERTLDFSTQWSIEKSGECIYLGATICHNDTYGRYMGTSVGEEKQLFGTAYDFLLEHQEHAKKLLRTMYAYGYFGPVGFDAMLYRNALLHPIVEINARKTMGWVALHYQNTHHPNQRVTLTYSPSQNGILPTCLPLANVHFSRNLDLYTNGAKFPTFASICVYN